MASSSTTVSTQYAKRPGTAGVRGHLYETKLLSLINFTALHNDEIQEFNLATNLDKIGSFDDICITVKMRNSDHPFAVFIQAKHRENNSLLMLNKNDWMEYLNSYMTIRRSFNLNNNDVLFKGTFGDTRCFFVIYTTAKSSLQFETYGGDLASNLNALIGTRGPGLLPTYDANIVEHLCRKVVVEQITTLARQMAKCIHGEFSNYQMLMTDEVIQRYHVILAQKVFDISEEQHKGLRIARFRHNFFDVNENFLKLFKDQLCTEILQRRRVDYVKKIMFLFTFLNLRESSNIEELYKEFGDGIIYKNGKFEFLNRQTPVRCKEILGKINQSQTTIRKTVELAVRECLPSLEFNVPASFGNKDLTIAGTEVKVERRLKYLTRELVNVIEKNKYSEVIVIDNSVEPGFLKLNGGLASAVGNLLVSDKDAKLLKFNDNYESLGPLAKKLFDKLQAEIKDFNKYKLDIKIETFPKLSLVDDEYHKTVVKEFLGSLILFTSQLNEQDVEKALINQINSKQRENTHYGDVKSDVIYLKYHNEIQKWWMAPVGQYLTKEDNLYKDAVHVASLPMISLVDMLQRLKSISYTLCDDAENSLKIDDLLSDTVVVTQNISLTVAKLRKYLNNTDCFMLHLELILELLPTDYDTLHFELMNMREIKTLFIVFDNVSTSTSRIDNIVPYVKGKKVIIITDQISLPVVEEYFPHVREILRDERTAFSDLSEESQESILKNTKVIFQGAEVGLDKLLYGELINDVGGDVLYKIMYYRNNTIGNAVSSNYDSKLFVQRKVKCIEVHKTESNVFRVTTNERFNEGVSKYISTLDDISDDAVLIIGDPGIGKSTLLTYLSLKAKELNPTLWILRINLLEHSRQFLNWQQNKTVIDTLESVQFLCQVALHQARNKTDAVDVTLVESDGAVYLQACAGDEWTTFELNMFLNYYNTKELMILLDGFDEICPNYTRVVLAFIEVVKHFPKKHKIWITSRTYGKVISILELQFSFLYEIQPLDENEQFQYLMTFWNETKLLCNLHCKHIQNIYNFSMFVSTNRDIINTMKKRHLTIPPKKEMPFLVVYLSLVKFLRSYLGMTHFKELKRNCFDPVSKEELNVTSASNKTYNLRDLDDNSQLLREILRALKEITCDVYVIRMANKRDLVATPLHINMAANYLYNKIRNKNIHPTWNLGTNVFDIYEHFLETKLIKIRFQEKNKYDMSNPDTLRLYQREYADVADKHKKMAAYAVFGAYVFHEDELTQVKDIVNIFKAGEETTGIICDVVNDTPMFVHSAFAEYFAVEYLCDQLKRAENTTKTSMWDTLLNVTFFGCNKNVLVILDAKLKIDQNLSAVVQKDGEIIFKLLLEQAKERYGDIKSSLCEAILYDLRNVAALLLSVIEENLDGDNLQDFIEIVKETKMIMKAVKMDLEEPIVRIVNHVRIIDESKVGALFENLELKEDILGASTDDLLLILHRHVWTRMEIVPDWANVAELSGEIYFI